MYRLFIVGLLVSCHVEHGSIKSPSNDPSPEPTSSPAPENPEKFTEVDDNDLPKNVYQQLLDKYAFNDQEYVDFILNGHQNSQEIMIDLLTNHTRIIKEQLRQMGATKRGDTWSFRGTETERERFKKLADEHNQAMRDRNKIVRDQNDKIRREEYRKEFAEQIAFQREQNNVAENRIDELKNEISQLQQTVDRLNEHLKTEGDPENLAGQLENAQNQLETQDKELTEVANSSVVNSPAGVEVKGTSWLKFADGLKVLKGEATSLLIKLTPTTNQAKAELYVGKKDGQPGAELPIPLDRGTNEFVIEIDSDNIVARDANDRELNRIPVPNNSDFSQGALGIKARDLKIKHLEVKPIF